MSRVEDIRDGLVLLVERHAGALPPPQREVVQEFVNRIRQSDKESLTKVMRMLGLLEGPSPEVKGVAASAIAEALRPLLSDQAAFSAYVRRVAQDRRVTKAILAAVYKQLYRRSGGIRTSAARDELVQLIIDERNVLDRYGVLGTLAQNEAAA